VREPLNRGELVIVSNGWRPSGLPRKSESKDFTPVSMRFAGTSANRVRPDRVNVWCAFELLKPCEFERFMHGFSEGGAQRWAPPILREPGREIVGSLAQRNAYGEIVGEGGANVDPVFRPGAKDRIDPVGEIGGPEGAGSILSPRRATEEALDPSDRLRNPLPRHPRKKEDRLFRTFCRRGPFSKNESSPSAQRSRCLGRRWSPGLFCGALPTRKEPARESRWGNDDSSGEALPKRKV